jgi:hypothetical protein
VAQEDSEDSKGGLDPRPVSDDGNLPKLVLSTSSHGFERPQIVRRKTLVQGKMTF